MFDIPIFLQHTNKSRDNKILRKNTNEQPGNSFPKTKQNRNTKPCLSKTIKTQEFCDTGSANFISFFFFFPSSLTSKHISPKLPLEKQRKHAEPRTGKNHDMPSSITTSIPREKCDFSMLSAF
ncbi:hypothetical protein CDAR_583131 [Caerostris darwini]|uniref:Uncharacterized protein n=1 Tax=Caerostris darwini TaxID=1538125 RepID=A0AAV4PBC2_9ARAC|nr:hypothetical protein CDAR_583131 [Caerostris darwini]